MADEMLCIGHDNEILIFGDGIDDDFDKCCCCTEMIAEASVGNVRRLLWFYMIVPFTDRMARVSRSCNENLSISSQG
jgi:hypothetical protein